MPVGCPLINYAERLNRYFEPMAVRVNVNGTFGNFRRKFLHAIGTVNLDSAIQKSFPISETLQSQPAWRVLQFVEPCEFRPARVQCERAE